MFTRPERIIAIYNTPDPENLDEFQRVLAGNGFDPRRLELVYAADWLRKRTGLPGPVQCSPVDLDRFQPDYLSDGSQTSRPFTVGRLSRDTPDKHHSDDPALYEMVCALGADVKIMGGKCLEANVGVQPGIRLIPQGAVESHRFLQGLDCFLYRTSPAFYEPHGRVVTEAMACGLPVVCGINGGYSEFIEHGKNGFLFSSNQEACEIVSTLKNDAAYRREVGNAARSTVGGIFSADELNKVVEFYTR